MSDHTITPDRDFHVRQAVTRAMGPNASIEGPKPGGQYAGTAILVNDKFLVQQIGDKAIAHRREALGDLPLDDDDIKRPYKLQGTPLAIEYDVAGQGTVALDFDALKRESARMDAIEEGDRRAFAPGPKTGPRFWDREDVQALLERDRRAEVIHGDDSVWRELAESVPPESKGFVTDLKGQRYSGIIAVDKKDQALVIESGPHQDKLSAMPREAAMDMLEDRRKAARAANAARGRPKGMHLSETDLDALIAEQEAMIDLKEAFEVHQTKATAPAPKPNALHAFAGAIHAKHRTEQTGQGTPAPVGQAGMSLDL